MKDLFWLQFITGYQHIDTDIKAKQKNGTHSLTTVVPHPKTFKGLLTIS